MKVIYHDIERCAARVRFNGVEFTDGKPVDVPDWFMIKPGNPFFEVVEDKQEPEKRETLTLSKKG
jgi:hypothetical protein